MITKPMRTAIQSSLRQPVLATRPRGSSARSAPATFVFAVLMCVPPYSFADCGTAQGPSTIKNSFANYASYRVHANGLDRRCVSAPVFPAGEEEVELAPDLVEHRAQVAQKRVRVLAHREVAEAFHHAELRA